MRRLRSARRSTLRLTRLVRRGRELPALALACVWVFGAIVAPLVHLAMHASLEAHSHAPSWHAASGGTCHDGHCHESTPSSARAADDDSDSPDHGRGSLAHGDLAALFPAPALVIPPFVAIGERASPLALSDVVEALSPPVSIARGPPTLG